MVKVVACSLDKVFKSGILSDDETADRTERNKKRLEILDEARSIEDSGYPDLLRISAKEDDTSRVERARQALGEELHRISPGAEALFWGQFSINVK